MLFAGRSIDLRRMMTDEQYTVLAMGINANAQKITSREHKTSFICWKSFRKVHQQDMSFGDD